MTKASGALSRFIYGFSAQLLVVKNIYTIGMEVTIKLCAEEEETYLRNDVIDPQGLLSSSIWQDFQVCQFE